jgi:hypothetical protein
MFVVPNQKTSYVFRLFRQVDVTIAGVRFAIDVRVVGCNQKSIEWRAEKSEVLLIVQFHAKRRRVVPIERDDRLVKSSSFEFIVMEGYAMEEDTVVELPRPGGTVEDDPLLAVLP